MDILNKIIALNKEYDNLRRERNKASVENREAVLTKMRENREVVKNLEIEFIKKHGG